MDQDGDGDMFLGDDWGGIRYGAVHKVTYC